MTLPNLEFVIGPEAIRSYKRLSYKAWYALVEFVDNATQSYFDHQPEMDAALSNEHHTLEVFITYDRAASLLRIADNAFGMDEADLSRALHIGMPPPILSGRSEYGMGLKTAACWFGEEWTVTTKKLGSDTEFSVTVDVEAVASGNVKLEPRTVPKPADQHYTIVEIRKLNRTLNGWAIRNIKEYLSAIYKPDLERKTLDLEFDHQALSPLPVFDNDSFLHRVDGTAYRAPVGCTIDGHHVGGWLGVLAPGVAARRHAGFTLIRRGRVIMGWLDAWRPEDIFGVGGRNDLLNQRLTGELVLDDFQVSHTKDAILFTGDEEEKLISYLKTLADGTDLIHVARTHRGDSPTAPSPVEKQAAVAELQREMETPEFIDTIRLDEVPPPELERVRIEPLMEEASNTSPDITVRVDDQLVIKIWLLPLSPNDPYYGFELGADGKTILLTINENHAGFTELRGEEAVRTYLKHCAFDAVAEWKCRRMRSEFRPESVRQVKDQLLPHRDE